MWKENFEILLNVVDQSGVNDEQYIAEPADRETEEPDLAWNDIDNTCQFIKSGKSPGPDVVGEMLKAEGVVGKHMLYRLFKRCWNDEEIPEEWKEGL